jgi:hypothetical protein
MEKKIIIPIFIISLCIIIAMALYYMPEQAVATDTVTIKRDQVEQTLWKYQCIDTMKTSRDRARGWAKRVDLKEYIGKEMKAISEMGANCVALDTPYDQEFLPYLKMWVESAREHKLKIWYRGNFSGWEGWFEYPKGMTTNELFDKTRLFISSNPDLFIDGDIFTAAPEAENGGLFNQVEVEEYAQFKQFLIDEQRIPQEEFKKIGKKIETHWLSMNGGLARRMLDSATLKEMNNTVTIDHYIKAAPEMGEYINYFRNTFGSKIIIGEFGAPIPDITGNMTEEAQAKFIDELFYQLYINRESVEGLNYWILTDGSTQLLNPDLTPRKAVSSIRKYMKPTIVTGQLVNTFGDPIRKQEVAISGSPTKSLTDEKGNFTAIIPTQDSSITITSEEYVDRTIPLKIAESQKIDYTIVMEPRSKDFTFVLKTKIKSIINRL